MSFRSLLTRLHASRGATKYAIAVGLVAFAFALRMALTPVWGAQQAFTVFYPAVMLATYLGGWRAGGVAGVLSAGLGLWAFLLPAFVLRPNPTAISYTLFFLFNCAVAVLLIHKLTVVAAQISQARQHAEAAARGHAELFRELNERASNHLQLVAGLLALQGAGTQEPAMSGALARASETSLVLARTHRQIAGADSEPIEFSSFARALIAAKLADDGQPLDRIVVEGERFLLSYDQATSLGVALLECSGPLLLHSDGPLRVAFESMAGAIVMRFTGCGASTRDLIRHPDAVLLRAAVRQVGGRLSLAAGHAHDAIEISLRTGADQASRSPALGAEGSSTLH